MNVFSYSMNEERFWEINFLADNGYTRKTTFYADLSIAEWTDGLKGVRNTYKNVMKSWKGNIKYLTEFVMCLNHKSWEFANDGYMKRQTKLPSVYTEEQRQAWVELYKELYYQAYDTDIPKMFKGKEDDLSYFYSTLD